MQTQVQFEIPEITTKPRDMNTSKNCSQPEFYILARKKWTVIFKSSEMVKLRKDEQGSMIKTLNQFQEGVQEEMEHETPILFITEIENTRFPGMVKTPLADILLTYGVEQISELCKEMSKHFGNSSKSNSKEGKKIVTWLRTKFGNMVKALDQLQKGTHEEMEHKIPAFLTTEAGEVESKLLQVFASPRKQRKSGKTNRTSLQDLQRGP